MAGRATFTIDKSRTTMNCPMQTTARSSHDGPRVVGGDAAGPLDRRSPDIGKSCQESVMVPNRPDVGTGLTRRSRSPDMGARSSGSGVLQNKTADPVVAGAHGIASRGRRTGDGVQDAGLGRHRLVAPVGPEVGRAQNVSRPVHRIVGGRTEEADHLAVD